MKLDEIRELNVELAEIIETVLDEKRGGASVDLVYGSLDVTLPEFIRWVWNNVEPDPERFPITVHLTAAQRERVLTERLDRFVPHSYKPFNGFIESLEAFQQAARDSTK